VFSHNLESSSDEEPFRRPRPEQRGQGNSNDFRVEIPEYEGKLDPEDFLDWLHIVERVFEYKDVPKEKKVKLVALGLRKYASLWWTNFCDGDHHEKPKHHQAQPREDSLKLQEVKEVAKLCRKLVFMPEEVMPPSSRNFPVFVCTFGLTKVVPQLGAPHGFEV